MNNIQIVIGGKALNFAVKFERDDDMAAPWESTDGHGPVTGWVTRPKRAGELVLNTDRESKRYYDYAEACKIARRDGWDSAPFNDGSETKRQQAAKAARSNFEYLRAWCNNEWEYVGVIVTLLDDEGNPTDISDSIWGTETFGDYHHETARQIADDLAGGYGTKFGFEHDEENNEFAEVTAELEFTKSIDFEAVREALHKVLLLPEAKKIINGVLAGYHMAEKGEGEPPKFVGTTHISVVWQDKEAE